MFSRRQYFQLLFDLTGYVIIHSNNQYIIDGYTYTAIKKNLEQCIPIAWSKITRRVIIILIIDVKINFTILRLKTKIPFSKSNNT